MQHFQQLAEKLDTTSKATVKVDVLKHYFQSIPPEDAAWALYFLTGRKLPTNVSMRVLKELVQTQTGLPIWMMDGSNHRVNDYAETLALLLPWNGRTSELSLSTLVLQLIQPLAGFSPMARRDTIRCAWENLNTSQRVLFNKMLTGGLKLNVTPDQLHSALAQIAGTSKNIMARRLAGKWEPGSSGFNHLIKPDADQERALSPYPFACVKDLLAPPESLGAASDWFGEWNYKGIRVQLVRRKGTSAMWSEQMAPLDEQFPELIAACDLLPTGTVIEGTIMPFQSDALPPATQLDKRLRRKKHPKLEPIPVVIHAQDLLEWQGESICEQPFVERRNKLNQVIAEWEQQWKLHGGKSSPPAMDPDCFQQEMFAIDEVVNVEPTDETAPAPFGVAPLATAQDWEGWHHVTEEIPKTQVEGFLLKHPSAPYPVETSPHPWWHWLPRSHRAQLVLSGVVHPTPDQPQSAKAYLFAAMDGETAVAVGKAEPSAKASFASMLDTWIPKNTLKKKGPVHFVKLEHVFDVAFHDLCPAPRTAASFKLDQLQVLRIRPELSPDQACRLDGLKALMTSG